MNQEASETNVSVDTERKLAFLRRAQSYPQTSGEVEVLETHMSWLFLTERHVYKMKKPVRFDFLDFSTLDKRRHDCEEEVRLNRRLAGDVYLGVVALNLDQAGALWLGDAANPVEWLVKMKRLPRDKMLDHAIEAGSVDERDVRRFTRVLSRFYRNTGAEDLGGDEYIDGFSRDIRQMRDELSDPAYRLDAGQVAAIAHFLLRFLEARRALFEQRVAQRRIVEAHGDLRPEHVCLTDPPVFIDCLEFKRRFRILDPAEELAFLTMECDKAGAPFIGPVVFDTYRAESDDAVAPALVLFYKAKRALLRAELSVWHLKDHDRDQHEKWIAKAADYLELAMQYCRSLDAD